MSNQNIELLPSVWVEIPSLLSLTVKHRTGGLVVYTASDTEPSGFSPATPIVASTSIGQTAEIGGTGLKIWAMAISGAVISYTEISDSKAAVEKFDEIKRSSMGVHTTSFGELYTELGRRFIHKFDLVFLGDETKYFLYDAPAGDFIFSLIERTFKSLNGSAEIEVLSGASGFSTTNPVVNIQKTNLISANNPNLTIYNLSDGVNSEPTNDGVVFDTDFTIGSGQGGSAAGGISPQVGSRLYPSDVQVVVKVTNLSNSDNRISLEYSWIELPSDYLT